MGFVKAFGGFTALVAIEEYFNASRVQLYAALLTEAEFRLVIRAISALKYSLKSRLSHSSDFSRLYVSQGNLEE